VENPSDNTSIFLQTADEWREWLQKNCKSTDSVWLVIYHKTSSKPSVRWHDAIEYALCYGWVDSKAVGRNQESCYLRFTPRNPKSKWGRRNRERAKKMIENGYMTEYGKELIEIAKQTGKWELEQ